MTELSSALSAFRQLGPEQILQAVESTGRWCDGHQLALNSYENRVYQVGIEEDEPLIAKFYRPERWSDEAILEEHAFCQELAEAEIPVVAPLLDKQGESLLRFENYRFALFPRRGGRAPELDDPAHLETLGRFMARIHNVGAVKPFQHRPTLDVVTFGDQSRDYLLASERIPGHVAEAYETVSADVLQRIRACYERAGDVTLLRLHGDAHPGNILWRDDVPHIVDLDDARSGPAIQDLWMFLSGDRRDQTMALADVLEGYTQFRDFDPRELNLIEASRSLRIMHHAAWLARRWDDPAFPLAFPYFSQDRYWEDHVLSLREQLAQMDEAPLLWN